MTREEQYIKHCIELEEWRKDHAESHFIPHVAKIILNLQRDNAEISTERHKLQTENADYKSETGQWSIKYHDLLHEYQRLD